MKISRLFIVPVGGLLTVGLLGASPAVNAAGSVTVSGPSAASAPSAPATEAATETNQALKRTAKLLARSISKPQMRRTLHQELTKSPRKDAAVSYQRLVRTPRLQRGFALERVDTAATAIRDLQVSVPVALDKWDPSTEAPLVAYAPVGVDESDTKTVTAYDSDGTAHQLSAKSAPTDPVIVVGVSEEVPANKLTAPPSGSTTKARSAASSATYEVKLKAVNVISKSEFWYYGEPEFYLAAKGCGVYYHDRIKTSDAWGMHYKNILLGTTHYNSACTVTFYWYENDSNTYSFLLEKLGVAFGVEMSNEDDLIGGRGLAEKYFKGASWDWTGLGEIDMATN